MSSKYRINNVDQNVHFSKALMGAPEKSRMKDSSRHLTTFNAGDIVPIYCREILPEEDLSISLDFVIRQTTLLTPTMDSMHVDIYAFWVPNRIINQSWKAVEGENYSGSWVAPDVSLVPLKNVSTGTTTIPVGSVADYYGFPTQKPMPNSVLALCHDLKFRGYVMIYNEHFRDQNYQPPIAMSTLNVYQGFLDPFDSVPLVLASSVPNGVTPDGSVGAGAIAHALVGSGKISSGGSGGSIPGVYMRQDSGSGVFKAFSKPLKANKLHDYFTSVLPSPQKSLSSVLVPVTGVLPSIPVSTSASLSDSPTRIPLLIGNVSGSPFSAGVSGTLHFGSASTSGTAIVGSTLDSPGVSVGNGIFPANLSTQSGQSVQGLNIDISDIRMASAIQQVYEILGRGGSRYRSIVSSFFGVEYDNPFVDVPSCLGHISRDLDLYQTAQTSASESGSTPQGNLTAFGYTANGGHLFSTHFVEHGYVHIFAVVRHKNLYSSYFARDNFRLNMLDFYTPPLGNISEQPVFAREINPFAPEPNDGFGFQEAWAEYRFEPDQVSGLMRTMPEDVESLSVWNYADNFDDSLQIADGNFMRSNSEEVLNRTLAVTSDNAPQFKGSFLFHVDKTLPMPTYSVPGMDII